MTREFRSKYSQARSKVASYVEQSKSSLIDPTKEERIKIDS